MSDIFLANTPLFLSFIIHIFCSGWLLSFPPLVSLHVCYCINKFAAAVSNWRLSKPTLGASVSDLDTRHCQLNDCQRDVSTCARRTGFLQRVEKSLVVIYLGWELILLIRAIFGCVVSVSVYINCTMAGLSIAKNKCINL